MPDPHRSHDPSTLRRAHEPAQIAARLERGPDASYLRDAIYGAIDGAVTTFAVVSGVEGGGLDTSIVIVMGLANLLADGFSMAASNYLGTRADEDRRAQLDAEERRHIREFPDGEREEIRQIFIRKGFEGETLERAVDAITSVESRWVETMLSEEYGLSGDARPAWRAAAVTLLAFCIVGAIPLAPYLARWASPDLIASPFMWSVGLTGAAFFLVGAAKGHHVEQRWYRSGAETLLLGSLAASLAYGVGLALRGIGAP
jgi:VIT1/CCC1 family predicted Fe2+/Mn2+ transporter